MAAASSSDQCHLCKEYGHFQRDCPKKSRSNQAKRKGKNKKGGGSTQPKWCAYHKTTTHSDAECLKQQKLREKKQKELQGLAANLALLQSAAQGRLSNLGSAHLAQSSS